MSSQKVDDTLRSLLGKLDYMSKSDFKLAILAMLGYVPTEIEIDMVYNDQQELPYSSVINLILKRLKSMDSENVFELEMYRMFDTSYKGYFTIQDVFEAFKVTKPPFSWSLVFECFRDVSIDGKIDFELFKHLCGVFT